MFLGSMQRCVCKSKKQKKQKKNFGYGYMILSFHLKMGTSDVLRNTCPPKWNYGALRRPYSNMPTVSLYPVPVPAQFLSVSSLATILRFHLKNKCFVVYFGICHYIFPLSFPFSFPTYFSCPCGTEVV